MQDTRSDQVVGTKANIGLGRHNMVFKYVTGLLAKSTKLPFSFAIHSEDGESIPIGGDEHVFDLYIRNQAGLKAIKSLNELKVAESYIRGDIDIEGDFIKALSLRHAFSDRNILIKKWRRIAPILFGRERLNPQWIAKHYDLNNIQLMFIDADYHTYTPGIYESEETSLEAGAELKLDTAFQSLRLKPGDSVLDIGCGWGGFLRFAERKKVQVTGITLSRDQKQYVDDLIKENNFNAKVMYQDLFSFQPSKKYDGIVLMGVLEDLSDYQRVMDQLPSLVKPGGRIYMDFAVAKKSFHTSSFTTKYVWPGTFRAVYMPQFIDAIRKSPFEIVALYNDRRNYYLWSKKGLERWVQKKEDVIKQTSEALWRTFRLLLAGVANGMSSPSHLLSAYRMILELPEDTPTA